MSGWVRFREYAASFEAELDRQALEQAGIPVMLNGPVTGVFGPGFAGPTANGVTLLVPADHVEDARDLLGDDED